MFNAWTSTKLYDVPSSWLHRPAFWHWSLLTHQEIHNLQGKELQTYCKMIKMIMESSRNVEMFLHCFQASNFNKGRSLPLLATSRNLFASRFGSVQFDQDSAWHASSYCGLPSRANGPWLVAKRPHKPSFPNRNWQFVSRCWFFEGEKGWISAVLIIVLILSYSQECLAWLITESPCCMTIVSMIICTYMEPYSTPAGGYGVLTWTWLNL